MNRQGAKKAETLDKIEVISKLTKFEPPNDQDKENKGAMNILLLHYSNIYFQSI